MGDGPHSAKSLLFVEFRKKSPVLRLNTKRDRFAWDCAYLPELGLDVLIWHKVIVISPRATRDPFHNAAAEGPTIGSGWHQFCLWQLPEIGKSDVRDAC